MKGESERRNKEIMEILLEEQSEEDRVKKLTEKLKSLTSLDFLSGKSFEPNPTAEAFKSLAVALQDNETITDIDIRFNEIEYELVESMAKALKTNKTLTSFNISYNEIKDAGAKALAMSLEKNQTLKYLDLSFTGIKNEGVEAVITKAALKSLFLSSNEIGDEGVKALVKALETNKTLTTLDLRNNKIKDAGAKALAMSLKYNTTLTTLNLDSNEIGTEGAIALAEALETNKTLTTLNLDRNKIGTEGIKALAKLTNIDVYVSDPSTYFAYKIAYKLIDSIPDLTKKASETTQIDTQQDKTFIQKLWELFTKKILELFTEVEMDNKKSKPLTYKSLRQIQNVGMDNVVDTIILIQGGESNDERRASVKKIITEHVAKILSPDQKTAFAKESGMKDHIEEFVPKPKDDKKEEVDAELFVALSVQQQKEIKITTNNMLAGLKPNWRTMSINILGPAILDFLDLEKNPEGETIRFIGNDNKTKETKSKSLKDRIDYLDKIIEKDSEARNTFNFYVNLRRYMEYKRSEIPNSSVENPNSNSLEPAIETTRS